MARWQSCCSSAIRRRSGTWSSSASVPNGLPRSVDLLPWSPMIFAIRSPASKKTLERFGDRPELQTSPIAQWFRDLHLTTDLLLGMIDDRLDVYQESYSDLP